MLRKMGFAILLLVIISPALAMTEARLLNHSTSGHTVVFNLGSHDGIKEGDYGVILKKIHSLDSRDLRIIPAAKARNIKLNTDSSVWILYKVYDPELLVKGDKFVLLAESHLLNGRRPPHVGRIQVVSPKKSLKQNTKNATEYDDGDRISKLKDKYQTITSTHEYQPENDYDAQVIDLDVWKSHKDTKFRSSIYKSAHKEEWRRQLRLSTFEKIVTAYLARVNDPDFNYDKFYEKQKKSAWAAEFNENSPTSEYNMFLREQSNRNTADAKLYRSLLEKGESWSEDYSDEELRIVLNKVSVLQEKDRRDFVISKPNRYSFQLDYGFFLNDSQTKDDPKYQRDNRYSIDFDFEATPFLKHQTLERFTFNGTLRFNHTAFESDGLNSDLDETSISLGVNWYPVYAPYTVEAPVWFLGTYLRSGFGRAYSPTADEKANYTVLSFPGFRGGFKYLMRNNFGIRLLLSMETLNIERYEASKLNSVLPEQANIVEAKMAVGLAYAF